MGLEEFSEETEPRVLLCNKSNCGSNHESKSIVVEVKAEESKCISDEECESSSICGDDWIGIASSNWMQYSTATLTLQTDTDGSIGCR